jgi:hypothetical protein
MDYEYDPDPESEDEDETRKLSYIGYEDTVINHILLMRDMNTHTYTEA